MEDIDAKNFGVEESKSLYSSEERITVFQLKFRLSNTWHEEDVTLELCHEE